MSNQKFNDQSNDPELADPTLVEMLNLLQNVPERDPGAARSGRAKFVSEVDALLASEKKSAFAWITGLFAANRNTGNRGIRFAYSAVIALIAVVFVLLSGAGATAYAAKNALPGDVLYQVKTGLEQAQMRLTSDAARQAQLHLEFAERRLAEIAALIEEEQFAEIDQAAGEFEYHVQQAIRAMQVVAGGDPARANQLASQIADALSRYGLMLSEMLDHIPDNIRPSVERAINTSRNVQFEEMDDNSNGSVNANDGDDLSNTNGNQNGDDDTNSNDNDSGSGSGNENDNAGNENENENDNENDNLNGNENSNHNENTNQNDNDSGNSNENDNEESKNDNTNNNDNDNNDNDNNDNGNDNDGNDNDNGGNDNDNGGGD